ncbi:type I secretion system permease/ATPase [Aliarcobacter cryaerophilus]|uniref:type I secretion system permease/ATPase n=1 Tax=Aliarcobacter cryaerophilus TaxID=28198 RepID=UPI0016525493|nr:type I secretion system permease/ATPase [Aliarcobacter cryaerophilus]MCT7464297.1 type I secretion system permease/ATPase [Aliarcobacter cryaerophilus]MCT7473195.1 type I secretion system permease/ATPase [Aliarcobacter cryaerophilus]MCT7535415.1 type I secretion system permease/ATPase [Aliarcobacter cryaerophilus]
MQKQEKNVEQGDLVFEDNNLNRDEYPLLFALKNILDFYFGEISLNTIISFSAKSNQGFTTELAIDIVREVGLTAVARDIKALDIPNHFLPCIIFDDSNIPYVLKKKGKECFLYDPIKNEEIRKDNNYLKNFKKAILVFRDPKKEKMLDEIKDKDWFWNPVKKFRKSYIEIGILTFFINIFALALPLFSMSVYDRVVPNNATETLFVLAVGVVIILLFDIFFKSVRNYIIEKVGKELGVYLEEELLKRVLSIQSQYDVMLVGTKANLFRELALIKDFFATKSVVQVVDFPFFFLAVTVIFIISPMIALVPLLVAILVIVFNFAMQVPISNLSKKNIENIQAKHSFLVETIQGSEMIKLSNARSTKLFNWRNIIALTDSVTHKIQSLNVFSMNLSQTVIQFVTLLVIFVGVFEIANKNLSVGGLIAVTILASRAMVPVIQVSMTVIKLKEIKESLNNINDFWHLPLENDKNIEIGLGEIKGNIEFKNVDFYYKNSKYPSLDNCNIKIKEGEKVGIIGQTGAGKSTFLRILTGLDAPTKGSVYLDDHEISTIHPIEIRQNIGVMPQEPFLFSGTLKENIELATPVSKKKLMELIKITGLEDLVKKSGQGDGLQVGERGSNLSVGQRHLVALARALINNPPILILDEPTTGLDVGLEKTLISHMKQVLENKTLIVITHRFAALDLVDRIIVLNQGKVVADGPKNLVLASLQEKR